MVELNHVGRGPYVEETTIKWNRMMSEAEANEIVEAADGATRSALENKIEELEKEIESLRFDRNTRVRWAISIARKMLAGNAGIREEADLYWHMKAQLQGETKAEMDRRIAEERAARETADAAMMAKRAKARRKPALRSVKGGKR